MYTNTLWGGGKEDEIRQLFCSGAQRQDKRQGVKLKCRKFCFNITKELFVKVTEQVAQRGYGDTQNLVGHGLEQSNLSDPA